MKFINSIVLVLGLALGLLSSCETHSSDNGDLDNWWYLRQVDDLTAGTSESVATKKIFWSYIGNLMQTEGGGKNKHLYRFEHKGGTLRVYEPRAHSRNKGDTLLWEKDLPTLEPQMLYMKDEGNNTFEETFTVEQLTSSQMILLNEDKSMRLHFTAW